ncbi:MAG: hypothetical protein ACHP7J_04515 [Terriglobales bacterium]
MRRILWVAVVLLLSASTISAGTITQKWTPGWDIFNEPLNYTKSNVKWSVSAARKLTLTYTLVGATPSKLYQVDLTIFCNTFPTTFGQFPVDGLNPDGTCPTNTRQGVTASEGFVEVGVVTTDMHGNGSFKVVVGPVPSGTYNVEFRALNGAGCGLIGGGPCDQDHSSADFQSPGPIFGDTTTITVP